MFLKIKQEMRNNLFGSEGDCYLFADWLAVVLSRHYFVRCLKVKAIEAFLG